MAIGTTLRIAFDSARVRAGLDGIKNSIRSIGRAGIGIAKVGAALTALGVAGVAALGAVVIKLDEIGSAGRSGDRRLQSITKQMGLFGDQSEAVAERLIEAADAEAQLTGIDPQLVQTKLMTFKELAKTAGEVGGAFDRATTAALDMQAAGFGQAEQNAVQLGKALNDPIKGINSLARSGITFTTEEKKKIAVLVQSNKMLEAQTIILKAIETQVGGTAAASATASGRIKKSFQLVVESFAEEMSVGFDKLPDQFQKIMPAMSEVGAKAGKIMGDAIADSVMGNHEKFIAIGEMIGTIIAAGAKRTFQGAMGGIGAKTLSLMDAGDNAIRDFTGLSGIIGKSNIGERATQANDIMSKEYTRRMMNSIRMAAEPVMNGTQGLVPNTGGRFQYAAPGQATSLTDATGNPVVEVLKRIEQNTSQGSKM